MANKLKVEVVAPDRRLLSEDADEVIAPGADGLFGVRYGHTPYLALLQPGPLTIIDGGSSKKFFVAGGFAEAAADHVRVLAEGAEALESIDLAAARNKLQASQKALDAISPSAPEYAKQAQVVKVDTRRVEVAEKR
jgi:F-type H+-transporting ATPase subunit epsilon